MVAVRQKPADQLAFKRGGRGKVAKIPDALMMPVPRCPSDVGEYAAAAWSAFWAGPTARLVQPHHLVELHDWIRCVHARDELWRAVGEEPTSIGSMGQEVASWRWLTITRLEAQIARFSAKFGMTPLDWMRLTGALDQAEAAEESIKKRREGRRPTLMPAKSG